MKICIFIDAKVACEDCNSVAFASVVFTLSGIRGKSRYVFIFSNFSLQGTDHSFVDLSLQKVPAHSLDIPSLTLKMYAQGYTTGPSNVVGMRGDFVDPGQFVRHGSGARIHGEQKPSQAFFTSTC